MPTTTTTLVDPLSSPIIHQQIGTQINHPGVDAAVVIAFMCCITVIALLLIYFSRRR